ELAEHDAQVEQDGQMQAVGQRQRRKPPPRRVRHQRNLRAQLQDENGQIRGAERAGEQRVRQHPQEPHGSSVTRGASTPDDDVYSFTMPIDIDAAVISNTRLSQDYSVLA